MAPTCPLKSFCRLLYEFMLSLGIEPHEIVQECSNILPCNSVMDNTKQLFHYVDQDNADVVLAFIKKMFSGNLPLENSIQVMDKVIRDIPFRCPELGIDVYQPCTAESCSFWTNNIWTRNCILNYRVDHYCETLDLKELSFLLEISISDLKQRIATVLARTRKWALKTKIEQETVSADYTPVRANNACCVCGKPVVTPDPSAKYIYCGVLCSSKKPPYCIDIEKSFHLPIERILQISTNSFSAIRPICHALGINQRQLVQLCEQHHVDISSLAA